MPSSAKDHTIIHQSVANANAQAKRFQNAKQGSRTWKNDRSGVCEKRADSGLRKFNLPKTTRNLLNGLKIQRRMNWNSCELERKTRSKQTQIQLNLKNGTERNGTFVRSFGPRNEKITILNVECIEWLSKCWTFDKDHRVIKLKCAWTQLKCPKQFQYFNAPAISFAASSLPFRCISSSNSLKMLNYVCGIFFFSQAIALFGASHSKTILAKWFFVLFVCLFFFVSKEWKNLHLTKLDFEYTNVIYRTDSKKQAFEAL